MATQHTNHSQTVRDRSSDILPNRKVLRRARLAREARFDGQFFIAVKTTKIFCRPICPASPPKEENVTYFASAIEAVLSGYRPCLRCRPESAPGSPAWRGVRTTFERALKLIDEGALQNNRLGHLAERLGISERYLRQLFSEHLGISPKRYALYQQALFAKSLLHQTALRVTDVAMIAGFNSVRRFNDYFKTEFQLTPSEIRRRSKTKSQELRLRLSFRPPYNWPRLQKFFQQRIITSLEWVGDNYYGRSFKEQAYCGQFTAYYRDEENCFEVDVELDNLVYLKEVMIRVRQLLDLDADSVRIDQQLKKLFKQKKCFVPGLRIPGLWHPFEAGVRAILGQQVSVKQANTLVKQWLEIAGTQREGCLYFPCQNDVNPESFLTLKIPESRKQTLIGFLKHALDNGTDDCDAWQVIKGIGPWTIAYSKLRAQSACDQFLNQDLGVKKACVNLVDSFSPEDAAPWGSYLTLQLWEQL